MDILWLAEHHFQREAMNVFQRPAPQPLVSPADEPTDVRLWRSMSWPMWHRCDWPRTMPWLTSHHGRVIFAWGALPYA